MAEAIEVLDGGRLFAYTFDDLCRYHGYGSPGGVAHAFQVLARALPLLEIAGPLERREITVRTAFGGPGARDGFEMVTRAVTDGRYLLDDRLVRADLGRTRERFVFVLAYHDREVTLILREGFVTDEFLDLARTDDRTEEQEQRLDALKDEMASLVMGTPAANVYDAAPA